MVFLRKKFRKTFVNVYGMFLNLIYMHIQEIISEYI